MQTSKQVNFSSLRAHAHQHILPKGTNNSFPFVPWLSALLLGIMAESPLRSDGPLWHHCLLEDGSGYSWNSLLEANETVKTELHAIAGSKGGFRGGNED